MEILLLAAFLAVILGVTAGLVVKRRRRLPLEPPPEARVGLPEEIKQDVAQRKAEMIDRIEERERLEREAAEAVSAAAAGEAIAVPQGADGATGLEGSAGSAPTAEAGPNEELVSEVLPDRHQEIPAEAPTVPVKPRFRDRLAKAREKLAGVFGALRRSKIDDETWEELEYALIGADVGVEATQELLDHLRERVRAEGMTEGSELLDALKGEMKTRLSGYDRELHHAETSPSVWLFVGVNGVGKTTTIGKVAKREIDAGRTVVMAAGDTFRAAAAEQLETWADRVGAECVRGNEGGDPSAVIYDAVERAAAINADVVLADTAGRLHTKVNLMEELRKVRRVAEKGAGTVSEVLLVLDATTGQNGLVQAQQFTEAVDLTGVVLTKLDGSAKGGIIFAIQEKLGIPVKLVGLGETVDDLVPFDPDEFVEALFA
ncbi:MAG: signal recognition particle-docking protein FtsY [Acidimicrobiales bacterium]|nr:signal recognition particle-docking protein FtsY [Acidimicrobiales bacterium]